MMLLKKAMAKSYDVTVVGGGMVGMGVSLAMANIGYKVALLEAQDASILNKAGNATTFDDRTLVVNPASIAFWESLGIWSQVSKTNILNVHVSNQGHFGTVNFSAKQLGVNQLGSVVAAKQLAHVLWNSAQSHDLIDVVSSASLIAFKNHKQGVEIQYQNNNQTKSLSSSLMVAADGARSGVRSQLGLEGQIKSYQRTAIVCNVTFEKPHNQCAYERLTLTGPLALLPFEQGRYGLVWSVKSKEADNILTQSDKDMAALLENKLSHRLGRLTKVGRRSSYPIYQVKVPNQIAQSVVLMGNAAHTVSPVSAQGLNLAVRGMHRLQKVAYSAKSQGIKLSTFSILKQYQNMSKADQQVTMNYTDDLMTLFKLDAPWLNALRSAGLLAVNSVPVLKRHLFERAGGLK